MKENKTKRIIELLESIVIAALICFLLFNFVFIRVQVKKTSMNPTLNDGDNGFSFIITKNIKLNRFDIVVAENDDKLIVKRLIGMPNETIEYKDNVLYIDGVEYEEEYLGDVKTNDFKVELGEDEYYLLGDNREVSKDSRFVGPFSKEDIKASHVFVFYPFKDFGFKK